MALTTEFKPLVLDELRREAAVLKADGWRFIQTHAVNGDDGVDLYYSFMKDGHVLNLRIEGVRKDQPVPSITDLFLAAFVFENEARELFGVDMRDIAIDFHGSLYAPAQAEPMTFITPEQKAAREKARKAAEAKAAKAAAPETAANASSAPAAGGARTFVMTPELQARLDKKMATMSDEKKAKVEAALAALAAGAAAQDGATEPSAKAEASPAAASAPASAPTPSGSDAAAPAPAQQETPPAERFAEEQLEGLISQLDDAKAAKVRAALAAKGGE